MDIVAGIIVIVVVWALIAARGAPGAGPAAPRPAPRRVPPPRRTASAATARRSSRDLAIERERQADAAFADGVLFSHYFLEPRADHAGGDDVWDDGFGDDYDDGMD